MPSETTNSNYKDIRLVTHPTGHNLIQTFTPLHVTNLFLLALKDTFSSVPPDLNYPFTFNTDYNKTGILIDTVYNRESNIHGKPYLVVGRGPINTQPIVIGDRIQENYTGYINPNSDNTKFFRNFQTTQVHSSINIKIISKHSAEVDILSNEVFSFLVASRTAMTKHMPIQMSSSIMMSEISKFEQDDTMFFCSAQMSYVLQYKWVTWMLQNLIKSISVYLSTFITDSKPPHTRDRFKQEIIHLTDEDS